MARSVSPEPREAVHDVPQDHLDALRTHLDELKRGIAATHESAQGWKQKYALRCMTQCRPCSPPIPIRRRTATDDLDYSSGISLLSLKNHLLLSYLQHIVALFSLKLSAKSLTGSDRAQGVVAHLVKLRVVLEKIAPLEQKLKYQIEKLVRKADQFDEQGAQNEDEVLNGEDWLIALEKNRIGHSSASAREQTRSHSGRIRPTWCSTARSRRTRTTRRRSSALASTARRGSPPCPTSRRRPRVSCARPPGSQPH